jgi:hypothetical protein
MTRLKEASTALSDELTSELIAEVQSPREELRAVDDAVDELRESIERITHGYRQDDGQPVQRSIVSLPVDPCDPQFVLTTRATPRDRSRSPASSSSTDLAQESPPCSGSPRLVAANRILASLRLRAG